jgi:transposase
LAPTSRHATRDTRIAELDRRLAGLHKHNPVSQLLTSIPGIGPVAALAFATAVDIARFTSGRAFAAFLGMTPKDHGADPDVWLVRVVWRSQPIVSRSTEAVFARFFVCLKSRFFAPAEHLEGGARRCGQGWPKATAQRRGAALRAPTTWPGWLDWGIGVHLTCRDQRLIWRS